MCYSFESSLSTASISFLSFLYLINSSIPEYQWLGVTLLGWTGMQFTEGLLWLTHPEEGCTLMNKIITVTFIPLILIFQPLGSLFGSFFDVSWNNCTLSRKIFIICYAIFVVCAVYINFFSYAKSYCTIVTNDGHLNWFPPKYKSSTLDLYLSTMSSPTMRIVIWAIIIGFPLLLFWNNTIELLLLFLIPLIGAYLSLQTDSSASIWCWYTSYSSILFALLLLLHNQGICILKVK